MLKHILLITYLFVISAIYPSAITEKQNKSPILVKNFDQLVKTVEGIKSARHNGRQYTPSSSATPHDKSVSPHSSQEEQRTK